MKAANQAPRRAEEAVVVLVLQVVLVVVTILVPMSEVQVRLQVEQMWQLQR